MPQCTYEQLKQLLEERRLLVEASGTDEGEGGMTIQGMTVDSREVQPGMLFVCKGAHFNPIYLTSAVEAGSPLFLCEATALPRLQQAAPSTAYLAVSSVRTAMAAVAPLVYQHPDQRINVVGITGTKGKSTTAYMLQSILKAAGKPCGIMGSIMTDDGVEYFESHNTTPEAPELWNHLSNLAGSGRTNMVMEVSSHGLKYERVDGLNFDIACFLNIGRDHISPAEHPDFEDYFASKLKIFQQCSLALVNLRSDNVDQVLAAARKAPRLLTFGVDTPMADLFATNVTASPDGVSFTLVGNVYGMGRNTVSTFDAPAPRPTANARQIKLGITGLFNTENALAAIAMAQLLDVPMEAIEAGLATLRVPGRMELVRSADDKVLAVVDYAHNVLSFKSLFNSLAQEYPDRRIIAVFGAPGNKAQERRVQLPQTAAPYCDLLVYTEEDPAYEAVADICAEMAAATPADTPYLIIEDREQAVEKVLRDALADDRPSVVALLAKGDETRQHRGDNFPTVKSDLALAREILEG